jgi:type I restriction enzyme S subunit
MSNMVENILPEGWVEKKLKEYLIIQNGFAFNSKKFNDNGKGTPLIRIRNLKKSNITTYYDGDYNDKFIVTKGDFLIGMDGEFRCYEWNNENSLLNQRVCRITDVNKNLDSRFLFYGINKFLIDIEAVTSFVTVKHISARQINEINFPIPPLEEQKRIVAKIDTLFAKIDKAISLTEESLIQAKNLLPSVLKEVFEKGKADGWEEKKLGEVIEKTKNVNPKTSSFDEFTYIDISAVDKSLQEIVLPKTVKSIGAPSRAKKSIELDDILFATTRPNLKNIAIVSVLYEFPIASTGFCVVRSNSETHNRYLFYYLISDLLQEQIEPYIRGAQYPAISDKDLKSVLIPVPNLKEQIQLSELFDKISEESKKTQSKLEEQLAYLKQLKSSILTKAFKGEL